MSDPKMNDQTAGNADDSHISPQMISPGARLAAYRQDRGWTVEQVASQLNLAPRQIIAIESDDYPSLPGMPIVRGFIRAYAKLLKVDAAPLLATLGGETVLVHESVTPRKTLSTPFSEARLPSMAERPGLSSKWLLGLLVAVLVGVAVWAVQYREDAPAEPASSNNAPSATSSSSGESASSAVPTGGNSDQQGAVAANPGPSVPPVNAPAGAGAPVLDSANPVLPPSQSVPSPGQTNSAENTSATSKDVLVLTIREDSWIEVRRAGEKSALISRLAKAGTTETVEITSPTRLVVGNAAGVDATLRGAPLELKSSSTTNVARLNLK
jgi:cytoskeleton protein RodZ